MGQLSRCPVAHEDKLLVSENAASNLLSLAAQIALEVALTTGLFTPFEFKSMRGKKNTFDLVITFSNLNVWLRCHRASTQLAVLVRGTPIRDHVLVIALFVDVKFHLHFLISQQTYWAAI